MTKALVLIGVLAFGVLVGTGAQAAQTLSVEPDGSISFEVSTTGVTRISIKGDRIRRLVNTSSDFEVTNDPETGDLFLRYIGLDYFDTPETGFLVAESGVTIGYSIHAVEAPVETVLISLVGVERDERKDETSEFSDAFGYTDDIAKFVTGVVRDVARKHVLGRQVPSGRDGRIVRQIEGEGWTAVLRVAVADQLPRLVREQEFYEAGVLAVWVQKPGLAAGERSWVIVVEGN